MASMLSTFFAHNTWANLCLYDLCAELTPEQLETSMPGVFGSIGATLVHIAGSQEYFLGFLIGQQQDSPLDADDPFPGFELLRPRVKASSEALEAVADTDTERMIARVRGDGRRYEVALSVTLLQAINHATEHRAQIAALLTQLGIEPPDIDGWDFDDARSA